MLTLQETGCVHDYMNKQKKWIYFLIVTPSLVLFDIVLTNFFNKKSE